MKKAKESSAKGHSEEGEDSHKEVVARHTPGEGSQIVHQGHLSLYSHQVINSTKVKLVFSHLL